MAEVPKTNSANPFLDTNRLIRKTKGAHKDLSQETLQ